MKKLFYLSPKYLEKPDKGTLKIVALKTPLMLFGPLAGKPLLITGLTELVPECTQHY